MTIKLKDRAIQRHLDAISGGKFSVALNSIELDLQSVEDLNRALQSSGCRGIHTIPFGDVHDRIVFMATISECDLESVPEFDPRDWNSFPEITPPEDVWMRVETKFGFGFKARFKFGEWLDNRNDIVGGTEGDVIRFRLWDEEGEEQCPTD